MTRAVTILEKWNRNQLGVPWQKATSPWEDHVYDPLDRTWNYDVDMCIYIMD